MRRGPSEFSLASNGVRLCALSLLAICLTSLLALTMHLPPAPGSSIAAWKNFGFLRSASAGVIDPGLKALVPRYPNCPVGRRPPSVSVIAQLDH
jgi:hypothetical protein